MNNKYFISGWNEKNPNESKKNVWVYFRGFTCVCVFRRDSVSVAMLTVVQCHYTLYVLWQFCENARLCKWVRECQMKMWTVGDANNNLMKNNFSEFSDVFMLVERFTSHFSKTITLWIWFDSSFTAPQRLHLTWGSHIELNFTLHIFSFLLFSSSQCLSRWKIDVNCCSDSSIFLSPSIIVIWSVRHKKYTVSHIELYHSVVKRIREKGETSQETSNRIEMRKFEFIYWTAIQVISNSSHFFMPFSFVSACLMLRFLLFTLNTAKYFDCAKFMTWESSLEQAIWIRYRKLVMNGNTFRPLTVLLFSLYSTQWNIRICFERRLLMLHYFYLTLALLWFCSN